MPKEGKTPKEDRRNPSKSPARGALKSPRSPGRLLEGSLRRGGVSSEAVDEKAIAAFEKTTFPKSAEEKAALNKALTKNILFRYLDDSTRSDVFESMEPKSFAKGQAIITQGDEGDYFYLIHKGSVDVIVNRKKVSTLAEGGYFGELALIYGTPRSATCIVKSSEVTTFRLDRQHYRMLLMGSLLRKRQMYEEFLKKIDFLADLDSWELLTLADALQSKAFEDGSTVFKQGDEGDDFFIIVNGEAEVFQRKKEGSETQMDTLKRGQYFGEVAIILNRTRTATIKARGKLEVVKIDRDTFERILGPCQEIMRRNMDRYNTLINFYSKE